MKYLKACFLSLAVLFSTSQLLAAPAQTSITVNQCYTTEEGVFILVGNRWLGAEAVNFTADGIFVKEEGNWLSVEEAVNMNNYWVWTCSNCGTLNAQGQMSCTNCGKS